MTEFLRQCAEKDTLTAEDRKRLVEVADKVEEVVHAEWLKDEDDDIYCSNCQEEALCENVLIDNELPDYKKSYFCPNCGAKMDKGSA